MLTSHANGEPISPSQMVSGMAESVYKPPCCSPVLAKAWFAVHGSSSRANLRSCESPCKAEELHGTRS